MVSVKPVTVPVNIEVHECECCQPRPASELARLRRVNRRLLANRRQLIAELKHAYHLLHEARAGLAHYDTHCRCLTQRRPAVLLWDSVRRDTEAQRKAAKRQAG